MSEDPFLRDLRHEREALAALVEPLERGHLISGDPEVSKAALIGYKRQLVEMDQLIEREEAR